VSAHYDSRDRSFSIEKERIGDFTWRGVFAKQRAWLDLGFHGESSDAGIGSNFRGFGL